MTVNASTSRSDATGNGVTTAFTGSFRILDQTHIVVYRTQISTGVVTTLALTTDYTVSGVGGTSFTVTTTVAPTSDQRISILRNVPLTQTTSYPANDIFPAASHEAALDKLTMEVQQISEAQSRALTLAANSVSVSGTLPSPQALKIIGWDNTGAALANYDAASLAGGVATVNWTHDTFSGTGAQTAFTLTGTPGTADNCDVTISGVTQRSTVDYTLAGNILTFTSAPPAGTNNIFVRYGTTLPAGVPTDGTVTSAKLDGALTAVIAAKALDSAVVHNTGNETIAGVKTFSSQPILPQQSMVKVNGANGYGAANTKIRRFANVTNGVNGCVIQGADITFSNDPTLGASFTINTAGVYSVSYVDNCGTGTMNLGLSLNTSQPTTNIQSINIGDVLQAVYTTAANAGSAASVTQYFAAGSVIRPHTDGSSAGTTPITFNITRVS